MVAEGVLTSRVERHAPVCLASVLTVLIGLSGIVAPAYSLPASDQYIPAVTISSLGDSITAGYPYGVGDPLQAIEKTYPAALQHVFDSRFGAGRYAVINHGINGLRAEELRANLRTQGWLSENPVAALIMIGGNDLATATSVEEFLLIAQETVREVQDCVDIIKAHINPDGEKPKVVVSAFPPNRLGTLGNSAITYYNGLLRSQLVGVDLFFSENFDDLYDSAAGIAKPELMYDLVHPNEFGYQTIAENWYNALLQVIAADEEYAVAAAAGDIACDPANPNYNGGLGTETACRMKYTSDLLVGLSPNAVFTLGDNEQSNGALTKFEQSYDPTWGRVKSVTHPAVGNHEYHTPGASGYFSYFGAAAGDPSKGYYSYDLGTWHIIVLNSNCDQVGGCGGGSPEEQWIRADLAASQTMCTLAYWHHPRFTSGGHGNNPTYDVWWQDLYSAGVEVVLNGHDHGYERFAPQTPSQSADATYGIREFVVGTGGASHASFQSIQPNSEVRNSDTFGVLRLTLHPQGYDWQFIPESGGTFTDSGTGTCHSSIPTAVTVKSKNVFCGELSGVSVKVERREPGHGWRTTVATPSSLNLEEGLYRFTAQSTVRAGGVQYRFAHWEDETGTVLSTGKTFVHDVQSGEAFYAVYGPRQYRLTVEARNATTHARVPSATVEVAQLGQTYTAATNSRGRAIIGGIFAGQPFNLKITINGVVRYEETITITKNATYKAYIT